MSDQFPTAYTAEDYRSTLASLIDADEAGEGLPPDSRVLAALRIASRVVEPGVIEAALAKHTNYDDDYGDWSEEATAIRTALTKDIR